MLVQRERFDVGDDLVLELFVFALLGGGQGIVLKLELDILFLQSTQFLVGIGDAVECFENLRLQFRFHRGERDVVFEVILVEIWLRNRRLHIAFDHFSGFRLGFAENKTINFRKPLALRAGISCFKINNVAQQNLAFVQLIAPDNDRLKGQRIFAQTGDHRLAAGLYALGNRDFAFAGQEFDGTHLAQIHAHRIISAVGRLCTLGFRGNSGALGFDEFAALFLIIRLGGDGWLSGFRLYLFLLDDIDAHFVEHRINIFDLVGGDFLGRQNFV